MPVPQLHPGDMHTLRAELNVDQLRVFVDNAVVWEGAVGPEARFPGPVGIRSDNARLDLELRAGEFSGPNPYPGFVCKSGLSESE